MPWALPNMKNFYSLLKKGKLKSRICEALKFTDRKINNLTLKTNDFIHTKSRIRNLQRQKIDQWWPRAGGKKEIGRGDDN